MDEDALVITVAPTGAEVSRNHTPYLPITPDEIADEVARSVQAGAAMAHLHARLSDGRPTTAPGVLHEIVAKIRERADDVIINVSTGAAVGMGLQERARVLSIEAEVASLNMGSVNFGDEVFDNSLPAIRELARRMTERRISPELEIYELGMLRTVQLLLEGGVLSPPLRYNFVLGTASGAPARPEVLDLMLSLRESEDSPWFATGIGRHQLSVAAHSILRGGHVRVGFEDNIFWSRGRLARSNAELVERAVRVAELLGRRVVGPKEARAVLRLNPVVKRHRQAGTQDPD